MCSLQSGATHTCTESFRAPKGLSLNNHPQGSLRGSLRPDADHQGHGYPSTSWHDHPKLLGTLLHSSSITQCASCLDGASPVRRPDFPGSGQHTQARGNEPCQPGGLRKSHRWPSSRERSSHFPCGHIRESHVDLQDQNPRLLEGPGCSAPFAIGLGSGAAV